MKTILIVLFSIVAKDCLNQFSIVTSHKHQGTGIVTSSSQVDPARATVAQT